MTLKWFLRNIVLNILLLVLLISSLLIHTGHISVLTPAQTQEKGVETLQILSKNPCMPDNKLKQKLDIGTLQYLNLRTILQKKRLMLHYDCDFKLTIQGKLYLSLKNPPKILEIQEAEPVEQRSQPHAQAKYYPNLTKDQLQLRKTQEPRQ